MMREYVERCSSAIHFVSPGQKTACRAATRQGKCTVLDALSAYRIWVFPRLGAQRPLIILLTQPNGQLLCVFQVS